MMNERQIREEICDIGRRIYNKGYAAANDGNISYRFAEDRVLCTPTMISKGFMKPEDLCVVDMEGNQLSGKRKRTSEVFLHLTIMKERPEIKSICHCHPPHATAFGFAKEPVPSCMMPEVEIFLGEVPIAKYAIPGGQEFADTILPFARKSNVIILANHGVVSFGESVERAYWYTEILDAYCRILLFSRQLGDISYFSPEQARDLIELKRSWGFPDARAEEEDCQLCANPVFRDTWSEAGVTRRAFPDPLATQQAQAPQTAPADPREALVDTITQRVLEALGKK